MLRSGRYRLQMGALRELQDVARPHDVPLLCELLTSEYFEVRARSGTLIQEQGNAEHALLLLPHLEARNPDVVNIAARALVTWEASDFYAEVDAAVARLPEKERFVRITSHDGEAVAIPAPASMSEVGVTRAIEPGDR
jgi:hypothetical protein